MLRVSTALCVLIACSFAGGGPSYRFAAMPSANAEEAAAPAAPTMSASADQSCDRLAAAAPPADTSDNDSAETISRGDRISLAFYEVLEPLEDRWGANRQRLQEPTKGVQLRAELSHDYAVGASGKLSVPILGVFQAADIRRDELQRRIECAFDAFLGQKGFVNIVSVAKQPVYVVGKVKNAGSFAYAPGMTVLHAIALAGGFENATLEPWQVVEISREAEQLQLALDRAARMTARTAAINVAASGESATPQELSDLVGSEGANALMSQELAPRRLATQTVAVDVKALETDVDDANRDLELRKSNMPVIQQAIDLRQERVADLTKLAQMGSISRPVLIQAQTELMEAQERRQQTLAAIAMAENRIKKAEQALEERRNRAALANEQDLLEARTEAAKAASEGDAASQVLQAMAQTITSSRTTPELTYVIIRQINGAPVEIRASESTLLEPGDLVLTRDERNGPATAFKSN
jgi:protein involved in polysaccharide export with SLBB domain